MRARIFVSVLGVVLCMGAATVFAATSLNDVFSQLEQQYQLPTGILGKVANVESSGNPNAGSPGAAYGMFQWMPRSWYDATLALYGAPLDGSVRTNPVTSAKVTAFALKQAQNQRASLIQQGKIDMTLGLYMCHFLGLGGCGRFFQEYIRDPGQSAAAIFPNEARSNPTILYGKTLAGVLNDFARKLQVAGVNVNVPGNFVDANGVSLAYSYADVSQLSFLPAGATPPPPDSFYTYQPTYTPATTGSLTTPSQLGKPQTVPSLSTPTMSTFPTTQIPTQAVTTPLNVSTTTNSSVAPGNTTFYPAGTCSPEFYCFRGNVQYRASTCVDQEYQMCPSGCSNGVCIAGATSTPLSPPTTNTAQPQTSPGTIVYSSNVNDVVELQPISPRSSSQLISTSGVATQGGGQTLFVSPDLRGDPTNAQSSSGQQSAVQSVLAILKSTLLKILDILKFW